MDGLKEGDENRRELGIGEKKERVWAFGFVGILYIYIIQ